METTSIIIKKFKDKLPTINFVVLCNSCEFIMRLSDYNSRLNIFVCPTCGKSDYTLMPLKKYNELKSQAIQRAEKEPPQTFEKWTNEWQKSWDKDKMFNQKHKRGNKPRGLFEKEPKTKITRE